MLNGFVKLFTLLLLILFMLPVVAQTEDRPHIVFVVGEAEYRSELTMPALAQVLSSNYGFQTTVLIDSELEGEQTTSIEGLDTAQ